MKRHQERPNRRVSCPETEELLVSKPRQDPPLDLVTTGSTKSGYTMTVATGTDATVASSYAHAEPVTVGSTGQRSFASSRHDLPACHRGGDSGDDGGSHQPQVRRPVTAAVRRQETAMIDTLTRSRWIRTTTAAGLVPLLLVASVPACALRSDTSSMPAKRMDTSAAPGWLGATSGAGRGPAGCRGPCPSGARVEAVPVGTQTVVQLHDDEAPQDNRRDAGERERHAWDGSAITASLPASRTARCACSS